MGTNYTNRRRMRHFAGANETEGKFCWKEWPSSESETIRAPPARAPKLSATRMAGSPAHVMREEDIIEIVLHKGERGTLTVTLTIELVT